jgi:hypothetical protein
VASCCECDDEPSGSCAMELVLSYNDGDRKTCFLVSDSYFSSYKLIRRYKIRTWTAQNTSAGLGLRTPDLFDTCRLVSY